MDSYVTVNAPGGVAWIIHADPAYPYQRDEIVFREPDPWCFTMEDPDNPGGCKPRPITKICYFELED